MPHPCAGLEDLDVALDREHDGRRPEPESPGEAQDDAHERQHEREERADDHVQRAEDEAEAALAEARGPLAVAALLDAVLDGELDALEQGLAPDWREDEFFCFVFFFKLRKKKRKRKMSEKKNERAREKSE